MSVLDAHENIVGNVRYGHLDETRAMDLFNNQLGLELGEQMLTEGLGVRVSVPCKSTQLEPAAG